MRLASIVLPALLAFSLPACTFYFGDDDDDYDDCIAPPEPGGQPQGLRNPQTGQCEYYGGGGGWCDPNCGPCPADGSDGARAPLPSWGVCENHCTGLGEADCLATDGCRGGYVDVCPPNADCDLEGAIQFYECWAVDQTGPIQGDCAGLDAWSCSQHDDCRAIHNNDCLWDNDAEAPADPPQLCLGEFFACIDEPGEPDPGNCYEPAYCESLPPDCPPGSLPGVEYGCWTGYCIPEDECEPKPACGGLDEYSCVSRADCEPLYEGIDCVCDDTGCQCAEWVYDRCEEMAP